MEERIARLESDVAHLNRQIADIKLDIRALRDRMDARFDRLESKREAQRDSKFAWLLPLCFVSAAGVIGAMAHGFGWI